MDSPRELLHQIADPHLSNDQRAELRCRLARQREEVGDFEGARGALGELWHRVGERPVLEGLGQHAAATVSIASGSANRIHRQR